MASEESIVFKGGVAALGDVSPADTPAPEEKDSEEKKAEEKKAEEKKAEEASGAGIKAILEMVGDPDAQIADISRLIALEIAHIVQKMGLPPEYDPQKRKAQKELSDHVKALRELQRTLTEADLLSRKDTLNMDGPKFQFVFKAIVDFFRKALKEAKADEGLSQRVLLEFSDLIKTNDEQLRRDMNKIESGR